MRQITTAMLALLVAGCTNSTQNNTADGTPQDTVYDGDIIWREKLETKRPIVQLDNGAGDSPVFTIGDTSILRIRIPRFTEYEMHLDEIVGATVIRVDSSHNKFLVIPVDNQFSFVLMQSYPKGQVIRYTRNWNELKSVYDELIVPLDSMIQIGKLDFKAE
ncbi:MAG TPA: hypothetical protein VK658_08365 [Chryseolinea sp.]|nr:hypothetical protein [Chryseolinea sp.]